MSSASVGFPERIKGLGAPDAWPGQQETMFQLLFERSVDGMWLFDPRACVFEDCNQAALELMHACAKSELLSGRPADLSPLAQPDGSGTETTAVLVTALSDSKGAQRLEWTARRSDGEHIPVEVTVTPINANGRAVHVVIMRDISRRKKAEEEIVTLSQRLNRSITYRTPALSGLEKGRRRSLRPREREFKPDFSSHLPLLKLGLTPRSAEVLLWVAQGKKNADIATILDISQSTVKKHLLEIFQKLRVETRGAASLRALEVIGSGAATYAG
jgi:PAS domain S-box-containing protein